MGESKPCPFCGEEILSVAAKCRFCGEFLDTPRCPQCAGPLQSRQVRNQIGLGGWLLILIAIAVGLFVHTFAGILLGILAALVNGVFRGSHSVSICPRCPEQAQRSSNGLKQCVGCGIYDKTVNMACDLKTGEYHHSRCVGLAPKRGDPGRPDG